MSRWLDVANVYYLTPGSARALEVRGLPVAVFNIDGEYYAIKDACPTDGGALFGGVLRGDEIICPRHGERYSVKTGARADNPGTEKLETFLVRVSHGLVQIEMEVPEYH
ncbi:MAG: Rieske 2Fe-2S domain-containing protein [Sideroxyarcus sp.]|nr:Rieske 2Fe-2S domain-containing protein [Sideroxyarcus sp.]